MALTDVAERALDTANPPSLKVEGQDVVEARIKRGDSRLAEVTPGRKEAIAFTNNEHYVSVGREGKIVRLSTVPMAQGGDKPDHRVRISRDLIGPKVKAKVAALTQRVPGYQTTSTGNDSEDYSASRLAEKVAVAKHDDLELKRHHKRWAWEALVTEEGFIRPYWDSTVGPFVPYTDPETGEEKLVGMGEVGVEVYSGLEVSWEPGVDFEESRWITIKRARPVEDVEAEEGFIGTKLDADAEQADIPKGRKGSKLVMVTEYLERPCKKWPEGRRLMFANDRIIFPEEAYPVTDAEGTVEDRPALLRLSYDMDGSSDRGKGFVRSLIESMRQYDQAGNKFLEWVQLTLAPQTEAEQGTLVTPMTDEPGAIIEYLPLAGGNPPKVRYPGPIPQELERMQDRAQREMDTISFSAELPAAEAESGKQAQTLVTQASVAWGDFVEDFADGTAALMREILTLIQRHYTDERLAKYRGRTGWEDTVSFRGADLRGQTDVRVDKSSLEPRTRQSNEQRIMNIAQMFPGHFPPEVLISALEGGTAEKLIEGYEDDVARANRIISLIRSGQFWSVPMRPVFPGEEAPEVNEMGEVIMEPSGEMEPILQGMGIPNPETGEEEQEVIGERPVMKPKLITQLPGWMPLPFYNIPVFKSVITTWMKTDDWANLDEAAQRASMDVYDALLQIEAREAQRQAQIQNQTAESAGMENAAKRPVKQMGSLPALDQGAGI